MGNFILKYLMMSNSNAGSKDDMTRFSSEKKYVLRHRKSLSMGLFFIINKHLLITGARLLSRLYTSNEIRLHHYVSFSGPV